MADDSGQLAEEAMSRPRIAGFRLGVYIFKDAEVVDFPVPTAFFPLRAASIPNSMPF